MLDNKTIYERARFYTVQIYEEIEAAAQSYFIEHFKENEDLERIVLKFAKDIEYLEMLIEIEENK